MGFYKIAKPNEYLVRTGAFVNDIEILKKAWSLPFQRIAKFDITPINYTLSLSAMSSEKLEFTLPAVFTIGPKDSPEALIKFAHLLASPEDAHRVPDLVRGVIEGETRVIAAGLTMEEIFKERKFFKEVVTKSVQAELDQFGLFIYNANVKQLEDSEGSEYFKYLRMKSQQGAINQAKVDVAEARYRGDVGEKIREGQTREESSKVEASARIFESERDVEIAKAESSLLESKVAFDRDVDIAKMKAGKAIAMKEAELQREVEVLNASVKQEKLRADGLAHAKIAAEETKENADAAFYKSQREADAHLYDQEKKAEALSTIYKAQASGIASITEAFGSGETALQYLMMKEGLFERLSESNAKAINGLAPKITVWNTGGGEGGGGDGMKAVRDVFMGLPPLLTTIQQQTGISAPEWLAKMPKGAAGGETVGLSDIGKSA